MREINIYLTTVNELICIEKIDSHCKARINQIGLTDELQNEERGDRKKITKAAFKFHNEERTCMI